MIRLRRSFPTLTAVLFSVLAFVLCSCDGGGPKLYPVKGKLLYDGKPASGATVVFHAVKPSPENYRPGAVVGEDGSFVLRTYPHGEGAPEGDYVVLVTWFEDPPPGKTTLEPKTKISLRFSDVEQSPFKATVKPGDNNLEPFQLSR